MYERRPGTSPESSIVWSPGLFGTAFCIFVFSVKNINRCVKQELLHLKNNFFIKLSFFLLVESTETPLKIPDVRSFRGPSGDVPGTSRAGWVLAEYSMLNIFFNFFNFVNFIVSFFNRRFFWNHILIVNLWILRCKTSKTSTILSSFFNCFYLLFKWFMSRRICKVSLFFLFYFDQMAIFLRL